MVATSPRPFASLVTLQIANVLSGTANSAVLVLIPWIALDLTGSSSVAGLVVGLTGVSVLVAAPFVGAIIERHGTRRVSIVSDLLSAVSVVLFPVLALVGALNVATVAALAVLGALIDPAGYTARKSMIPSVATASNRSLEKVNSVHEALTGVGWVAGPAVGALLIRWVGAVDAMAATAVAFVVAALAVALIRRQDETERAAQRQAAGGSLWRSSLEGFQALRADRALWIFTLAIVILAGIYLPLESVVMSRHFKDIGEPGGLGLVLSAIGLGAVVGAAAFAWLCRWIKPSGIAVAGLAASGLAVLGMASLPPTAWFAAVGFLLGVAWGPSGPLENLLVQQRIPADLQSRVFGIQLSLFYAGTPIGAAALGLLVEWVGVQASFVIAAVSFLAVVLGLAALGALKPLNTPRHADRPDQGDPQAPSAAA